MTPPAVLACGAMAPPSPYDAIGGEAAVRALVRRFYHYMDTLPEARPIRDLHPADLSRSEEKLFLFLSGWLGGPPLYIERHGHPRLRARHLPFPIGTSAAQQWLRCMNQALADLVPDEPLRLGLESALAGVAYHMRNQPDP